MQRGGAVLSESQKRDVRASSAALALELGRIDEEAARLAATRSAVQGQADLNASLLAPVRKLSHDLLSEIFVLVVADYRIQDRNFGTPAIARVCYDWRYVAFSIPQLWTLVNIPNAWTRTPEAEVEAFVARSCQLPLHVHVEAYIWKVMEICVEEWEKSAETLKHIARLSAWRWRKLDIWGHFLVFTSQDTLDLPMLESVLVAPTIWDDWGRDVSEGRRLPLDFLRKAPNLRDATWEVGYPHVSLPWPALTAMTYILRDADADELGRVAADISRRAETLEVLHIRHEHEVGKFPPTSAPTFVIHKVSVAPNLRSLAVLGLGHAALPTFAAPSLSQMTLLHTVQTSGDNGPFTSIRRMLHAPRLAHSLRTLRLERVFCSGNRAWMQLILFLDDLRALSDLQVLCNYGRDAKMVDVIYVGVKLLHCLTRNEAAGSAERLPSLTHLSLHFDSDRYSLGKLQKPLKVLLDSRKSESVVDGVSLKALVQFTSDLGQEFEIP